MKIHNGTEAGLLLSMECWLIFLYLIESGSIPLEYAYRKGRIEF